MTYRLGFPNEEVERGFSRFLFRYYTPASQGRDSFIKDFVMAIEAGQIDKFMSLLVTLFAGQGYQLAGDAELLPQCGGTHFQDGGLLHRHRAEHQRRPYGHGGADRRLHLSFRVQVGQIRRRGIGANRRETVRLTIRSRLAKTLQNRGELLLRDTPDRKLESGGAIIASCFHALIPTTTHPLHFPRSDMGEAVFFL